jgi:hypothetical protein
MESREAINTPLHCQKKAVELENNSMVHSTFMFQHFIQNLFPQKCNTKNTTWYDLNRITFQFYLSNHPINKGSKEGVKSYGYN